MGGCFVHPSFYQETEGPKQIWLQWEEKRISAEKECLGREICYLKPPRYAGITFLCAGEIRSCVLWRCLWLWLWCTFKDKNSAPCLCESWSNLQTGPKFSSFSLNKEKNELFPCNETWNGRLCILQEGVQHLDLGVNPAWGVLCSASRSISHGICMWGWAKERKQQCCPVSVPGCVVWARVGVQFVGSAWLSSTCCCNWSEIRSCITLWTGQ